MQNRVQVNINAYRSNDALEKYTCYNFYPNERYLFDKYFMPGSSILDLGCGAGRTTVRLYELGYKTKGIDLSDVLINAAKKRFPYIFFEEGNFCDIKESDSSFDNILISHNGLDYAYPESEREKAIAECFRVLKTGGKFVFSSHNIKSLFFSPYYIKHRNRCLWMLKNWNKAYRDRDYVYDLKMYTFYASQSYITWQVEKAGFKLLEIIGFRNSQNYYFNNYFSPYIHYVFQKE